MLMSEDGERETGESGRALLLLFLIYLTLQDIQQYER
jgi:hypothetical protein